MSQGKQIGLVAGLMALLLLPPSLCLADGAPITDPYVWESLEEGQQIAVVELDGEGAAHTDLFASVVDYSAESHEFTFLVPLGPEAHDLDVQAMKGREFDAAYTESLDRRLREDWLAQRAYRDRVTDAVLPGALLLNGGVPAWLSALWGRSMYERRPRPEVALEGAQVFETESGRVAIYDMDQSLDIDALMAEEGLPEGVRQTLEEARGQQLAVVTLITNPEAGAEEPAPPEPEVRTLQLWDLLSGQEIPTRFAPVETVHALAFSPDGSHLAVALDDERVTVWNLVADESVATLPMGGIAARSMAFSPDNETLAVAKGRAVELWDLATATRSHRWEDETLQALGLDERIDLEQITFSPDGRFLALGGTQLVVLSAADRSPLLTLSVDEDDQWSATFSPDGRWLAAVRLPFGDVKLFDTRTWDLEVQIAERWATYGAAFSPDGARLAFLDYRGTLRVWRISDRALEQTLQTDSAMPQSIAFTADGTTLTLVGYDGLISAWDLPTGQRMTRLGLTGELGSPRVAAVTRDAARVAVGYREPTREVPPEEEYETGLRLSWTTAMQRDAAGAPVHRYPLGTGKAWANPIPLTRVYVVAPPGVGFEAQAPRIGADSSGFTAGSYGRPRLRIYDAPHDQANYAMDHAVTSEGQLWRVTYTDANPAQDVVITRAEPPALPLHYAPPFLAGHGWWLSAPLALALWLLAWRTLMGGIMGVRYTWFGAPFWRDSLYWFTVGPVRSLAFLPFLLVGLIAGFEFAGQTPPWSSVLLLSPLILVGHAMTAYRFARSPSQPAGSVRWLRRKAFWGFLVVVLVVDLVYAIISYAALARLGGIG